MSEPRPTTVLIVDDQAMVRAGFAMVLGAQPDLRVVGEAADGVEAVEACLRLYPDVVVMDVRMPRMDGVEATRRLTGGAPDGGGPRILILTTFDLDEYVYEAIRAGASGFMLKDAPPEDLVAAVRVVAAGEALLAPSVTRRMLAELAARPAPGAGDQVALDAGLTERELEVLRRVARGLSNAEIASELFLGEATVKTHVSRVLGKLGLRDRVQAVVFAYENGIVRPGE